MSRWNSPNTRPSESMKAGMESVAAANSRAAPSRQAARRGRSIIFRSSGEISVPHHVAKHERRVELALGGDELLRARIDRPHLVASRMQAVRKIERTAETLDAFDQRLRHRHHVGLALGAD